MEKPGSGTSAEGRTPPPPEKRFPKGRSGNPAGRPKGAISLSLLTRKVALKKHRVPIDGKTRRITLLELLIFKARAMAASGHPGAAAQINWLRAQIAQSDADLAIGGFLLAPAPLTLEDFIAKEEARNAGKVEPGTEIDVESEEFLKAVRREPSPLGEALQAFHKKYGTESPTSPALK